MGRLTQITRDESIRPDTTLAALGDLKPAFFSDAMTKRFPEINWQVTAGNSSPVNDGAAAVLLMNEERARSLGMTPRARVHAFASGR